MAGEKRDFNTAAATWDENPGRVKMAHTVAHAILGTVKPGPDRDVLDFGCGTGLLSLRTPAACPFNYGSRQLA
ncbi:MAG: hypothetical protein WCX63_09830, partial [Methanoregula sp.]